MAITTRPPTTKPVKQTQGEEWKLDDISFFSGFKPKGSYFAALNFLSPFVLVALLASTGIVAYWEQRWRTPPGNPGDPAYWLTVLGIGAVLPLIAWLLVAIAFVPKTRVDRANPRQVGIFNAWQHQFREKLRDGMDDGTVNPAASSAFREVRAAYSSFTQVLQTASPHWMSQAGYIMLRRCRHLTEEAWIEVAPPEEVISIALEMWLRLQNSKIETRDELRRSLQTAIVTAWPGAAKYFGSDASSPSSRISVSRIAVHVEANLDGSPSDVDVDAALGRASTSGLVTGMRHEEVQARAIVRQVTNTINYYRDERYSELIRARNQVMTASMLIGVVSYLILVVGFVLWSPGTSTLSGADRMFSAIGLYLVGASFGLMYRLYDESRTSRTIDDFGLSMVRLITSPIFSGLAAVTGVVFYAIVGGPGTDGTGVSAIISAFDVVANPQNFIVAAVFGLTPNLIINYVQQQSTKYIGDIQSTERSDGAGQVYIDRI